MRKLISFLIAIVIAIAPFTNAFALTTQIYADDIKVSPGTTITIPIKIRDNPGIMGISISVEYPTNIFSNPEISRGILTTDGLINDSINNGTIGQFNVVWTGSQQTKDDGVLFVVRFKVNDKIETINEEILLGYSQIDTFDEKYKDVVLDCKPIKVSCTSVNISNDNEFVLNSKKAQDIFEISDDSFVEIVNDNLEDFGVLYIGALPDDKFKDFKNNLSEDILDYGATIDVEDISKEELKELFDKSSVNSFVNSAFSVITTDEISDVIDGALKKIDASSIENIPKEKEEDFLNYISCIFEIDEVTKLPTDFNNEQKIEAVSKLYQKIIEETSVNNQVDVLRNETIPQKDYKYAILLFVIAGIFLFAASTIIAINRRKKIEK